MTREEAIKRFETLLLHVDTDCVMGMETTEAINVAIKALEQQEIIRCKDCERFDERRGCNLVEGLNIAKTDSYCSYAERREE